MLERLSLEGRKKITRRSLTLVLFALEQVLTNIPNYVSFSTVVPGSGEKFRLNHDG